MKIEISKSKSKLVLVFLILLGSIVFFAFSSQHRLKSKDSKIPPLPLIEQEVLGLRIAIPENWKIKEIKTPTQGPLEGISYEGSLNRQESQIFNETDKIQLKIVRYQETVKPIISLEQAIEILKPTKEMASFATNQYFVDQLSGQSCARFESWAMPRVECKPPVPCGQAPSATKSRATFVCPLSGDSSFGSFIYLIEKYSQPLEPMEIILNQVFGSIIFNSVVKEMP